MSPGWREGGRERRRKREEEGRRGRKRGEEGGRGRKREEEGGREGGCRWVNGKDKENSRVCLLELWRRKEKEDEREVRGELLSQVVVPGAV